MISDFQNKVLAMKDKLKSFALHLTMDNDDAQDLLQDTYLRALLYRDKFMDNTNLSGWLFTIMRNIFINNYRRKGRAKEWTDNEMYIQPANFFEASESVAPDKPLIIKQVLAEINKLEDAYRIPLMMHSEGYKYEEISNDIRIPLGTVKNRIFLARKKLAAQLA